MFHDRKEAALLLVTKLRKYKDEDCIVVGIPRGGVPVAYIIAKELNLPLDIVLTRKIGHPMNKEYAIGAASIDDYFIEEEEYVTDEYIKEIVKLVQDRLKEMQVKFKGSSENLELKGKTVIIVDDGIATGNTIIAAIRLLRKSIPNKIIVAVPVSSSSAMERISKEADEVISILVPYDFHGVGQFYESFETVSDEEVKNYLNSSFNNIKQ
jgi:putative phosphoribosyl transferase